MSPKYFEPIEHVRAQEARQKGMTVEQLLELERKNQQSPGVVIEDKRDAYQNMRASIRNNPKEAQRQKEGEDKAKENAAKAFNGVLAMGMPSTYYNLFNLDNLLSNGQALALDLGSVTLLGGAELAKLAISRKIAQNTFENRAAREIAEKSAAKTAEKNTTILTASNKPATPTSLAFFERPLAKLTEAERLGIPKGQERFIENNKSIIMLNAEDFAKKYGYEIPKTIEEAKKMYKRHNTWFRNVEVDVFRLPETDIFSKSWTDPKLKTMSREDVAKILASKGYPDGYRTFHHDKIGQYLDKTVFASPSMEKNVAYQGNIRNMTVMLQRPFSFRDPLKWHINADYRPISSLATMPMRSIGITQIGNAGPKTEIKLSTQHLIPVKIADASDKGTLLGDYLGSSTYKSGGKLNYLNYFK